MINFVHPAALLIIGALFIPLLKGNLKRIYLIALPLLSLYNMTLIPEGTYFGLEYLGYEITPLRVDRMSFVFGLIFSIITVLGMTFAVNSDDDVQHAAGLAYAGGALGVTFAGDFLTLFLFWESLTVTASIIIWSHRTKESQAAGYRYVLVHALGGLILLAGIMLRAYETGDLAFNYVGLEHGNLSSLLIFLGFGVNAAWPGLHAWLVDAYPSASLTGTVFLSAYTTKSAVYVLARAFPGAEPLIWIGITMTAFPIFFAVIENDLRKVLSYSLINQVGFMMVGVGIGTEMAINGTCAHAFAHILYKGLLFMSMGAVMYRVGSARCTDLGGLYKSMPWTCIFCCIGAASISAFPLFSGFISKSIIVDEAGKAHLTIIWFLLMFASAGVFHHSGIKIPFFAFFGHDAGHRVKEAPLNMRVAMFGASFLCIYLGVFPDHLYQLLPYPVEYVPYTMAHVVSQSQLLFFSALAFTLLMLSGMYPAEIRSTNLDVDVIYRKAAAAFYKAMDVGMNGLNKGMSKIFVDGLTGAVCRFFVNAPLTLTMFLLSPLFPMTGDGPDGLKAGVKRAFKAGLAPVGTGVFMATVYLFAFIFFLLDT